ncbi:MAG: CTP synthase [Erysipelotrichaceae bacterium]|nr:CTP synthase [Erysipelotrichaceae bacterium]
MKYVFVTGGVVSGLGKGITAASLGRLLKQRGYKVMSQKLDPYINVDPGTMSPLQHGEVYVTEDGAETDLDLGHYERFINEDLNKYSNLTTGKVYWRVLQKERRGEYLGQTIQTIPHITDEIKNFIYKVGHEADADIVITEIGGTVGDIESEPFIEAIRQISIEQPENTCFIHVTLVPYISGSDEYKSKPTQHSVAQLQVAGVRPNIIVARCDGKLPEEIKRKISLFCNVKKECVIENTTVQQLYEAPLMLEEQDFSKIVCEQLHMDPNPIDLDKWRVLVDKIHNRSKKVTIGLVGKYVSLHDAYLSVVEALRHGGYENDAKVKIVWIDSENVNKDNVDDKLKDLDGVIVPGGFGSRGIEGMIVSAEYCRTHDIPYFGICLGMQVAAIEFARNGLGYEDANSSEFNSESSCKIIHYIEGQNDEIDKGGTMRLGAYPCTIKENTLMSKCYRKPLISERHRHRYEFNNDYREAFMEKGMDVTGLYVEKDLVEAIEYTKHPFYIGVQYHPEFKSRPNKAHPIFREFIKAGLDRQAVRKG